MQWNSHKIREIFLACFSNNKHVVVPSSSLVPHNDNSLLFTNAGMVQFKDVFLGQEDLGYKRAVSVQRCVRSGGKHNDLDNVGHTARHHTFFEMLGNFSFGDYFKVQAVEYAWDFLVSTLKLPPEKLWVTVHRDDEETADLWLKTLKIDPARFSRCDADNFWSMGNTGPCGPCTEIFYDHGPHLPGGPPGSVDQDGDRYVEIWNLVFMQYNRQDNGVLTALPSPSVDTGMGLERLAAVLQNVHNNYDTDLFTPLISATLELVPDQLQQITHEQKLCALRIIADHLRSTTFLIMDGVVPSNEGRGYVLRRIMRRALRQGHKLGINQAFFHKLVPDIVKLMGDFYPDLVTHSARIIETVSGEEEQFLATLHHGVKLFTKSVQNLSNRLIPGSVLFKLYDTYGFPIDLIADMAGELGLELDMQNFEAEMAEQRERSRKNTKFAVSYSSALEKPQLTKFIGDRKLETGESYQCTIVSLYRDQQLVSCLNPGDHGAIVLDHTPFYAEGGGQIGDQGVFMQDGVEVFAVEDTVNHGKIHLHIGRVLHTSLRVGDMIDAIVDAQKRAAIVLNHTATHLLHLALHQVLGPHATQQGSLIKPERLRFDFSHFQPVTKEQLNLIEQQVNRLIRDNYPAQVSLTSLQDAKSQGAIGLFQEKYGEEVRMVNFGPSTELCGGTHAASTGDLGIFKIVAECGIASGIRRIEAVTGNYALDWLAEQEGNYLQQIQKLQDCINMMEKDNVKLKAKLIQAELYKLSQLAVVVDDIKVLSSAIYDFDPQDLKSLVDQLKITLNNAVIVLALVVANKVFIVSGVTKQNLHKITASTIVRKIAEQLGGKGGGRDDFASGGAVVNNDLDVKKLHEILSNVITWVENIE